MILAFISEIMGNIMDIIKKRVIDWDLQLRKERDFNEKFGTNLSLSDIKELTGSFRRLTEKSKPKIGKGILQHCEEFYLSLDKFKQEEYTKLCKERSAAFFRTGSEPKKEPTTNKDINNFNNLDEKLRQFKAENNWNDFLGERLEI
tara:strand:- start:802 stop:1239 length:438 start_codon:yes stop_codon:yes gene_type:complete